MTYLKTFNVLFVCTGNSARSIFAEAILNQHLINRGKFKAYSAGSSPIGEVNPLALEALKQHQIRSKGLRSKSLEEFAGAETTPMDFVITVCAQVAKEQFPYWPNNPMIAHWGVADPVAVEGPDEKKRRAFRDAFLLIRRRVELFASLPFDKLDKLALRKRINEIAANEVAPIPNQAGTTSPHARL